jgi:hypothetical protein
VSLAERLTPLLDAAGVMTPPGSHSRDGEVFARVEVLIAAWEEMHREATPDYLDAEGMAGLVKNERVIVGVVPHRVISSPGCIGHPQLMAESGHVAYVEPPPRVFRDRRVRR